MDDQQFPYQPQTSDNNQLPDDAKTQPGHVDEPAYGFPSENSQTQGQIPPQDGRQDPNGQTISNGAGQAASEPQTYPDSSDEKTQPFSDDNQLHTPSADTVSTEGQSQNQSFQPADNSDSAASDTQPLTYTPEGGSGFELPVAPGTTGTTALSSTNQSDHDNESVLTADMLFHRPERDLPQIHTFKRRSADDGGTNDISQPIVPGAATSLPDPATPQTSSQSQTNYGAGVFSSPLTENTSAQSDVPTSAQTADNNQQAYADAWAQEPPVHPVDMGAGTQPPQISGPTDISTDTLAGNNADTNGDFPKTARSEPEPTVTGAPSFATNTFNSGPEISADSEFTAHEDAIISDDPNTFPVPQTVQPTSPAASNSPVADQPPQITRLDKKIEANETNDQVGNFKTNATKTVDKIKRINYKPVIAAALIGILIFGIFNSQVILGQVQYLTTPSGGVGVPARIDTTAPVGDEPRILIPQINIDVPVVYDESSFDEDRVQKALERGVVHYGTTAMPGEAGNTVIVGHSSNNWWDSGQYKFAFILLDKLNNGDQIILHYEDTRYVYEVKSKLVIEPTDISVLHPTDEPTLTLITCTPPGTSWQRLVVQAKQVSPDPNQNREVDHQLPRETTLPSDAGSSFWNFLTNMFQRD